MLDQGLFHVLLLSAGALTTAALAGYAWRHRDQPGAVPFAGAMVAVTVWGVTDILGLTQTGAGHLFWERAQWFAIAPAPLLFFLFIADFTGHESLLSWRVAPLFFVIPAVTAVLAWTNPGGLMYTGVELIPTSGVVTIDLEFGPWFWIFFAYAYSILLLGFVMLLRLVVVSDYLYFDQTLLVVFGILAPLAGNALGVFDLTPLPGLDPTTYGFVIMGVSFGNAIFRYRLFDLLPATRQLGRQAALAAVDDGVVIVGDEQEILYLNEAAGDLFDCDEPTAHFGDPVDRLLSTDELDFTSEDALAELAIADRTYEVTTAPITDQHERLTGHTILLHDVTSRERRERMLRGQRDELARLEQLNSVIRSVNGALVGATTREGIAREVCETLASAGPYDAVWFGPGPSPGDDLVGMGADDDGPRRLDSPDALPDQVSFAGADGEGELAVDGATGPRAAMERDAWVTIPLVHGRTVYGALALQSGRDGGFGERELDVLVELGETIGHAFHAVEQQRLLVADAVVELEFHSTDPGALLVGLSEAVGPCTLDGLVPGEGGELLAYVTVGDAAVETVERVVADSGGVSAVRPIDENGSATVEVSLTDGSLCCPLVEYGTNVRSAEATDGTCRLVAEVSPETDVRRVVERVTDGYPETELRSKRELSPAAGGESPLPEGGLDELTDRQRDALEAAYRAGYFEWPRESDAETVAESLDIASPTLHAHLRKAENRILSEFFDPD